MKRNLALFRPVRKFVVFQPQGKWNKKHEQLHLQIAENGNWHVLLTKELGIDQMGIVSAICQLTINHHINASVN